MNIKITFLFILILLFIQNAFSYPLQKIGIPLSLLKEDDIAYKKIPENAISVCINIDKNISYKDFCQAIKLLILEKNISNIFITYKEKQLDISSHGMEWELTVELPNSSKNTKPLPF